MTTRTATLTLDTIGPNNSGPINSCRANPNRANPTWIVDWDKVFNGATGKCSVRADLLSVMAVGRIGTREGLLRTKSFECVNEDGYKSPIEYLGDLIINRINNTTYYWTAVSKGFNIPHINIPSGKTPFTLEITGLYNSKPLNDVPDYTLLLTFEWVEELNAV